MSLNPSDSAWLLVRKAPGLTNAEIEDVTSIHPVTLLHMRQRHSTMQTGSIPSRGSGAIDCPAAIVTP